MTGEETVTVRVTGAQYSVSGDRYEEGDEFELRREVAERHPLTLEILDDEEGGDKDVNEESEEDEVDEDGGDGEPAAPFNPDEHTVDEIREKLDENEYSETELRTLYAAEEYADGRQTALEAIDAEIGDG